MKKTFEFLGMDKTRFCPVKGPHAPHVIDEYPTVCHGVLEQFCTGREGNGLAITIESQWAGDAAYPADVRGYYEEG